jgi:hypothetical protein
LKNITMTSALARSTSSSARSCSPKASTCRSSLRSASSSPTPLTFPDYSAEERTYQLLNQVIGRVGRGHSEHEKIIVQSYDPERPVIRAALASDWDIVLCKSELAERKLFNFPPYVYVLKLACRMASSKAAEAKTEQFLYSIQKLGLPLSVDGPSPVFSHQNSRKVRVAARRQIPQARSPAGGRPGPAEVRLDLRHRSDEPALRYAPKAPYSGAVSPVDHYASHDPGYALPAGWRPAAIVKRDSHLL